MSWELRIPWEECPHRRQSRIDSWAIRCKHYKNKDKKCMEKNCPLK